MRLLERESLANKEHCAGCVDQPATQPRNPPKRPEIQSPACEAQDVWSRPASALLLSSCPSSAMVQKEPMPPPSAPASAWDTGNPCAQRRPKIVPVCCTWWEAYVMSRGLHVLPVRLMRGLGDGHAVFEVLRALLTSANVTRVQSLLSGTGQTSTACFGAPRGTEWARSLGGI